MDRTVEQRRLHDREQTLVLAALLELDIAPRPVCRSAVRASLLVPRRPALWEIRGPRSAVAYAALKTRASGITLGDRIFLRADFLGGDDGPPIRLLAHEVAHVAQFRRDGTLPFLTRYVAEYGSGLASGLEEREAYRSIGYEREARQVGDRAVGLVSS